MNCGALFPACEDMYRHMLVNCECVLPVSHSGLHVCAHMMKARRPIWERHPSPERDLHGNTWPGGAGGSGWTTPRPPIAQPPCPYCRHSMMFHDGDGFTEHYACCDEACNCAWEYRKNDGDCWEVTMVREP